MKGGPGSLSADLKSQRDTAAKLQELERVERSTMIANRLAQAKARKAG